LVFLEVNIQFGFKLMKTIQFIFLAIFIANVCQAQNTNTNLIDRDKEKYEKGVFNKQFNEQSDTSEAYLKLYDRIPDELPSWVFTPAEFGKSIKIVAFSDPNMQKQEAIQQAIHRSKAIYALLNKAIINNIADDYTNMRENGKYALYETKFQDFTLIKAKIAYNNDNVNVLDTFYTKYGEGVVLVDFSLQNKSAFNADTLEIKGEQMQVFIEKNFKKEKVEFFNLSIKDLVNLNDSVIKNSQYNYKVVNRGYDIFSFYGDQMIEFVERTYNYRCNIDFEKDSASIDLNYFSLNRGLWNAYITGLLSNITLLSKQLASKVTNSNDFYTLKNEGLVRTVARNKVSFGFNSFQLLENQFYIDLNGEINDF